MEVLAENIFGLWTLLAKDDEEVRPQLYDEKNADGTSVKSTTI